MTCDRVLNEETNTYEHRCLSGEGYNVFDDMACCKPCCYRSDLSDVHKRCADIEYEDLICPKGEVCFQIYSVYSAEVMLYISNCMTIIELWFCFSINIMFHGSVDKNHINRGHNQK